MPFSIFIYHHRLDYSVTTQSAAGFAVDVVRNELVGFVGTTIGVLALLAVARDGAVRGGGAGTRDRALEPGPSRD